MIKLVVADIDGTLYGSKKVLTPRTRNTINKLRENGILFGLASGRDIANMRLYPPKWGFDGDFDVYIGMNGAMLYDTKTNIETSSFTMNYEQMLQVYEHLKHFNFNRLYFCDDGVIYIPHLDPQMEATIERNKDVEIFEIIDDDLTKLKDKHCFKIGYSVLPEQMPELESYYAAHPIIGFNGFKTQSIYFEIMLEGVSKRVGLEKYCDIYDIKPEEVYTFGDTTNDVEMLAWANGVCLCNGTNDAKQAAKEITQYSASEEGFARYIEQKILK